MINAFAAMQAKGSLEAFHYHPGPLGHTDVEIEVEYCGVCHSDLSMIDNDWGRSAYPLVPGHEVIGTVAATGAGVTTLAVGEVVGLGWHSQYCMACSLCASRDTISACRRNPPSWDATAVLPTRCAHRPPAWSSCHPASIRQRQGHCSAPGLRCSTRCLSSIYRRRTVSRS